MGPQQPTITIIIYISLPRHAYLAMVSMASLSLKYHHGYKQGTSKFITTLWHIQSIVKNMSFVQSSSMRRWGNQQFNINEKLWNCRNAKMWNCKGWGDEELPKWSWWGKPMWLNSNEKKGTKKGIKKRRKIGILVKIIFGGTCSTGSYMTGTWSTRSYADGTWSMMSY